MTFLALFIIGGIAFLIFSFQMGMKHNLHKAEMEKKLSILRRRVQELEDENILRKDREIRSTPKPHVSPPIPVTEASLIGSSIPPKSTMPYIKQESVDVPASSVVLPPPDHEAADSGGTDTEPVKAVDSKDAVEAAIETLEEALNEAYTRKQEASTTPKTADASLAPLPPSETSGDSQNIIEKIIAYFKSGNTVVKVGVVVLFFGVSFLVKFATDEGYLPLGLRLFGAILGGIGLTALGWRLRHKNADFAQVIQGGGIGILFITIFAALRLYAVIPSPLAFFLFVLFASVTVWLALLQDSLSLAIFGITGGFAAPVLASTGQGNHLILFSYYLLLNLGILALAWHKSWRTLNLLGFAFTFIIGFIFGVLKYHSHHFWSVEPFLILFFLIYVTIPILFSRRQPPKLKEFVDGTLVFGNASITFVFQSILVAPFKYATAVSAFCMAVFYLSLGWWLHKKKSVSSKLLAEAFVAMGVIFATITIPLALDGRMTAAVWALEAAGIYWVSARQRRIWGRHFSSLLIFAAGIAFITQPPHSGFSLPLLNSFFLGALMLTLGALVMSYVGFRHRKTLHKNEHFMLPVFFGFGSLCWIMGGYIEIEFHFWTWWTNLEHKPFILNGFPKDYLINLSMAYISIGFLACSAIGRKLKWPSLVYFSFALVYMLVFTLIRMVSVTIHPFGNGGFIMWPLAIMIFYYVLFKNQKIKHVPVLLRQFGHATTLWLVAILGAWELAWLFDKFFPNNVTWTIAAIGLFPIMVVAIVLFGSRVLRWPLAKYRKDYLTLGVGPVLTLTWIWFFATNWFDSGDASPLYYIPVFNPLETVHALFLVLLTVSLLRMKRYMPKWTVVVRSVLGVSFFLWCNGVLLRAIHHFASVPYVFTPMYESPLVQMTLAIWWSIIGITLTIFASQKSYRWLWITGASFMGVVVVKLFLIDLSKSGTIERIISFISVGIILLLVGYFSPIPPNRLKKRKKI
jgi:uncharacterized membrane protein